jgi:hypothetical protein
MTRTEALELIAREARALSDAVSHDDNGSMIGQQWVGGNGGLLSRETIKAADRVRLALAQLDHFAAERRKAAGLTNGKEPE